jgi:hypothetical protein
VTVGVALEAGVVIVGVRDGAVGVSVDSGVAVFPGSTMPEGVAEGAPPATLVREGPMAA